MTLRDRAEGHAVADQRPLDADEADQDERLDDRPRMFFLRTIPHRTAQARRHEHDQGRGHEQPGGVTSIHRRFPLR